MNAMNYLIISYFRAVLFPVDLVTKQAILELARRASSRLFSRIFLQDEHGLLGLLFVYKQQVICVHNDVCKNVGCM